MQPDSRSISHVTTEMRVYTGPRGNNIYVKLDAPSPNCLHGVRAIGMIKCEPCRWLMSTMGYDDVTTPAHEWEGFFDISIENVEKSGKLSGITKNKISMLTDKNHHEVGSYKIPEKKESLSKDRVGNLSSERDDLSKKQSAFVPPPLMVSEPAVPTVGSVKGKGKVVETTTAPKMNASEKFIALKTKIVSCQVSDLQIYPPGSKEIEIYGKDYLAYLASLAMYAELVSERKTFQLTKTKKRAEVVKAERVQAQKAKKNRVRIVDGEKLVTATKKFENLEAIKETQAKARRRIKKAKYRARKSAEKVKKVTEKNLEVLKAVKVTQKLTKVLKRTDENLGWTVVGRNGKPVKVVKAGKVKQQSQSGGLNQNKNLSNKPTVSKTSSVGVPTEVTAGS